jgi:hypothetical protein
VFSVQVLRVNWQQVEQKAGLENAVKPGYNDTGLFQYSMPKGG